MSKRQFLVPDMYVRGIRELDPEVLKKKGIRLLILDYDNTLMESCYPYRTHGTEQDVIRIRESGLIPVIVSNNFRSRCEGYARRCGVDFRSFSLKPFPHTYRGIMRQYGCRPEETAAIGDQLLTDMMGASLTGIYRILSDPLSVDDNFSGTVSRWIEKRIFRMWRSTVHIQRGNYYDHL